MTSSKTEYPVIHLAETDSTSNFLMQLSSREPVEEFTVVRADFQTAGKGQRGNSWESDPGENLLFSIIMYPEFLEARMQFLLSQAVALGIKEVLDTISDGFSIKWPNDIYWRDRKICGTLIENDLMGSTIKRCVAGIGINLNQKEFHSPAPNPVSLWQITGESTDITDFLHNVVRRIMYYYRLLKSDKTEEVSRKYHDALFRNEGMHLYRDSSGEFLAEIVRVEPEGRLILKDEAGNERGYTFKEVQYIL